MIKSISIVGIRGIPASHGGFETFAEQLCLYLIERGWSVTVYCQQSISEKKLYEDTWMGIRRVNIPIANSGALGTIVFDWKSIAHAVGEKAPLVLTLGYNTAIFCYRFRVNSITNIINMDGIEWKRQKWNMYERIWLWLNEIAGSFLGNHLVADHPEIKRHLLSRSKVTGKKITVIPYGARSVNNAKKELLTKLGVEASSYCLVIARPEPENSVLEVVRAFSAEKRNVKLVVLGEFSPAKSPYHRLILETASDEVIFPGAIYKQDIVEALRFFCLLYIHGHQVGGTNPSLVEALGAGSPILAHDNPFNRWVAGTQNLYFRDEQECGRIFSDLFSGKIDLQNMQQENRAWHKKKFQWEDVLKAYEDLFLMYVR